MPELERGLPLRLDDMQGARLRVLTGRIWLTISDVEADFVLRAGEHLHIEQPGRVVVESWPEGSGPGTARIAIETAAPPAAEPARPAVASAA